MPYKGTKKLNPIPKAEREAMYLPKFLYDLIEEIGVQNNLINPRTKRGNRTKTIEMIVNWYSTWGQTDHRNKIEMVVRGHGHDPKTTHNAKIISEIIQKFLELK